MLATFIKALRTGASVPNPTPLKWAGVVVACALVLLETAKAHGVLTDVSETDVIEGIMALVVVYAQLATTDKIGLLPAVRDSGHDDFDAVIDRGLSDKD
jgi:hypothetical protein